MDGQIKEMVARVKEKADAAGGLKGVYFVACGGSQAAIYPAKYLLDAEAKDIGAKIYNSNEFVHHPPRSLDARCLVICCSLKATAETVRAVEVAKRSGAITIAMTGSPDTGMAGAGEHVVVYSNGDAPIYSEGNQAKALRIGFEILQQFENYPHYDAAMAAYAKLDDLVESGKKKLRPLAERFAAEYANDAIFYVLGAGPLYGTAYSMANCHLMEMQWRHAVLVHSGEYFHGPFETTDKDLPMILLMSTGATRYLDERVLAFLKTYAGRYMVVDAAEVLGDALDANIAEYFNSVVMVPLERHIVATMAERRGHSMDERRYMWKVDY